MKNIEIHSEKPLMIIALPACAGRAIGTNAIRRAQALLPYYRITMISDTFPDDFPPEFTQIQVSPKRFDFLRRLCHVPNEIAFAWSVRKAIQTILKKEKCIFFILCHGYTLAYWVGRYFKRFAGVSWGMYMHGHIFERPKGTYDSRITAFYKFMAPACYREADLLLALSPDLLERAIQCGARRERVLVSPNGLQFQDVGLQENSYQQRSPRPPESPLHLLYVGRFSVEKGINVLLEACRILMQEEINFHLRMIGSNPKKYETEARLRALGILDKVELVGEVDRKHLGEYYLAADVLCVPSLSEPLGNVVLEGLAAGCIVVASNVGGIPSMITDEYNGYLVAPSNPVIFAERLKALCQLDEIKKQALISAGVHTLENSFCWDIIGNNIAYALNKLSIES